MEREPAHEDSYDYDGADRLMEAQSPTAFGLPADEEFTYDDGGNREDPAALGDYDYDSNNRITASPGLTYAFDDDGNLETIHDDAIPTPNLIATLTWDFTNRLEKHEESAGEVAEYFYDPFGRRIRKSVDPDGAGGSPAVVTWYLWDGDQLLGEYAGSSGDRQVRYAYAGGFAPVQVAYDDGAGGEDVYDVHTDHLDTPRLLTDDTGSPVWQSSHEAYGAAQITSSLATGRTFNIRFPGQYYDAETGLHYNRFRYYDPEIGRYMSADPIGQFGLLLDHHRLRAMAKSPEGPPGSGGTHLHAYAGNSPANRVDPQGLLFGQTASEFFFGIRLVSSFAGFGNSTANTFGAGANFGSLISPLAGFSACGPAPHLLNAALSGYGGYSAGVLALASAGIGTAGGVVGATTAAGGTAAILAGAATFQLTTAVLSTVQATTGFNGQTAIGNAVAKAIYGF